MLYASSTEDRTKMRLMIPFDLLLEIKGLMNLMSKARKLDREVRLLLRVPQPC